VCRAERGWFQTRRRHDRAIEIKKSIKKGGTRRGTRKITWWGGGERKKKRVARKAAQGMQVQRAERTMASLGRLVTSKRNAIIESRSINTTDDSRLEGVSTTAGRPRRKTCTVPDNDVNAAENFYWRVIIHTSREM